MIFHDRNRFCNQMQSALSAPSALDDASHKGPWICVCHLPKRSLIRSSSTKRKSSSPQTIFRTWNSSEEFLTVKTEAKKMFSISTYLVSFVFKAPTSFSRRPTFSLPSLFASAILKEIFFVATDFPHQI